MHTGSPSIADRLRKPEYTGENRCTPCTVVNVVVAAAATLAVAVVWIPAAAAVAGVSLATIYFRGYLVPGTPTFTRRYLPEEVLRRFEKADEAAGNPVDADSGAAGATSEPGELLVAAGVVGECEDADDLCLEEDFEAVWWRRIRQLRDDDRARERLGSVLEVDPAELTLEDDDGRFHVSFRGDRIGGWDSRAAFLADLAAEPTLAEYLPDWAGLEDRTRTELLARMRVFLESCPDCESPLDTVEDVRKSCCRNDVVSVSVDCEACGATVFNGSYR